MSSKKNYDYYKVLASSVYLHYKNQNDMKKTSLVLMMSSVLFYIFIVWISSIFLLPMMPVMVYNILVIMFAIPFFIYILGFVDIYKVSVEMLRQEKEWEQVKSISEIHGKQLSVKDVLIFNAVRDTVLENVQPKEVEVEESSNKE